MGAWRFRLLKGYLRNAGRFAPGLVARQTFTLCFTPMRRPGVEGKARALLDQAQRFSVEVEGRRLSAYRWSDRTSPSAGTVLLVHGWNSRASRMTVWVEPLLAQGFSVVAFDMPAHGDSDGKRTDGLDMAKAVGTVTEIVGPLHGVISHSAGAFASGMAIAGGHLLGRPGVSAKRLVMVAAVDNPLVHITAFASALNLSDAAHQRLLRTTAAEFGQPMEEFSLSRIPNGWPQPTLLLHDPDDPDDPEVPYTESESVATSRPNITLVPVHGVGHHRIARHARVVALTVDFLTDQNPDWSTRMSDTERRHAADLGDSL